MQTKKESIRPVLQQMLNGIRHFAYVKPVWFAFILMGISAFFIFLSIKSIIPPPEIVTRNRFKILEDKIRVFAQNYPDRRIQLDALQNLHGKSLYDGWNNRIHYQQKGSNFHQLISFGQDGVPGYKPDLQYQFKL